MNRRIVALLSCNLTVVFLLFFASTAIAQWTAEEDAQYVQRFLEKFPEVSPIPEWKEFASPQRYDELFMGKGFDSSLQNVDNESGGMAWGLAYRMMSLNEMYRVTKDRKYLDANLKCIRAGLAARDDVRSKKLWTGEIAPIWGCSKYTPRGRAVFAVHTGMIVYPILDCLALVQGDGTFGVEMELELESMQRRAIESLEFHDRQWRAGSADGEGHYVGLNQEEILDDKPLPGNRLSAMGRALWSAWKLTGKELYRHKALAIGQYIKNRLIVAPDGAYYWGYWLAAEPVTESLPKEKVDGEDISHGSLTMDLPILLALEDQVFTAEEMKRLGKTITNGFTRLNNGVLFGDVTGNPKSNPALVQSPGRWLSVAPYAPEIVPRLREFYLKYHPKPDALDMALLLKHQPQP